MNRTLFVFGVALVSAGLFLACGGAVASDEQARRAYLGLDKAVGKAMQLGFDGFNSANSANITAQTTSGAKSGTMTVTGQVDQGSSANKGMRLSVAMNNYSDGDMALDAGSAVAITYAAPIDGGTPPDLDISLKGIPTGTLNGTLVGDFAMSGGLNGTVNLNLAFSGDLEDGGMGTVRRKAGTTTVTGTATSGTHIYNVNVSL